MRMKRPERSLALLALASLLPLLVEISFGSEKQQPAGWAWDSQPGKSIALRRGDAIIWQFRYGPDQPKPHFHPVALPDGRVVTWDRPPDHVWHHGLWFSWKFIQGVNYWEPDAATGKVPGRTEWRNVEFTTRPDLSARIEMDLSYRADDGPAVLAEKRAIAISAPDAHGTYHFDWTSAFTAGAKDVILDRTPLEGEPGGQPWGGYAGLSIRLAEGLKDRRADTTEGPLEFNEDSRSRSRARALDYHGLIGGKPVGVAICDHPDNLKHPSPWYVIRDDPMSYFSPAVLCYGPHTLPAGQSFTLRYRVIIHEGRWDSKRLEREYNEFVKSTRAAGGREKSTSTKTKE